MTPQQRAQKHRRLMMLLNQNGISSDQRHDMVHSWTKGRTESTKGLTDLELIDLVDRFEYDSKKDSLTELNKREKRSVVLTIAQRCGIHSGTDFEDFNRFMLNKSILKKELHKYSLDELNDLIRQFRGLERNYAKSAVTPGTKAYNHAHGFAFVSAN